MTGNRSWCFTLNNYTPAEVTSIQSAECKYIIFGREVGEEGTPHLQGFVQFKDGKTMSAVKTTLGTDRLHLEVCGGNPQQNITYCSKQGDVFEKGVRPAQGKRSDLKRALDDINDGMRSRKKLRAEHPLVMAKYPNFIEQILVDTAPAPQKPEIELHDWQKTLMETLKDEPDSRKVYFIIDETGGGGKSTFCDYVEAELENVQVMKPGKYPDMAYELCDETTILLIDCPRATYEYPIRFAEDVKDGRVTSSKYFSHQKRMKPCHVVFFMNEDLPYMQLSEDRIVKTSI